jgi:hypothetical protein
LSSSRSRTRCSSARSPRSRCHRAPPRERVPQPPPLALKRRKRTPDLVRRASAHGAARCEREPVASVEAQPQREREQDPRG